MEDGCGRPRIRSTVRPSASPCPQLDESCRVAIAMPSFDRRAEIQTAPVTALPTEVLETLRQDEGRVLYRSVSNVDRLPMLVLAAAMEPPSAESLRQLEHEYAYRDQLDAAWAVR